MSFGEESQMSFGNNQLELKEESESWDLERIDDYIYQLKSQQDEVIKQQDLKEAQRINKKIDELRQYQIVYKSMKIIEKNEQEIEDLDSLTKQQVQEFDLLWSRQIEQQVQEIKKQEDELIGSHIKEKEKLLQELSKITIPKVKFSREVLNMRQVIQTLIKTKNFEEAEIIQKQLQELQLKEENKWNKQYKDKQEAKKDQLAKKQYNEFKILQIKLEKQLQALMKQKQVDQQKVLQKIQNFKSELENKQNQELSKLSVLNKKIMSRNKHTPANPCFNFLKKYQFTLRDTN